ncbi:calcium-binding protein, partial [Sphingomonas sp. Leaf5]
MISIIANPIVALDMYETALAGYLAPVLAVKTANSIELRFDGGFHDEMLVAGMAIGSDGAIIAGTITDIVEYRDGTKMFAISGLNFPAVDLVTLVETSSYDEILERIFSEDMRLFGSDLDDRLYGSEGNDTIWGGVGDDEIEAQGGNDFLYGGIGDDLLVGGDDVDTGMFESFFTNNIVRIDDISIWINGPEGNDVAEEMEYFQFIDGVFVTDADSAGAQVMRLYDTILDRAP